MVHNRWNERLDPNVATHLGETAVQISNAQSTRVFMLACFCPRWWLGFYTGSNPFENFVIQPFFHLRVVIKKWTLIRLVCWPIRSGIGAKCYVGRPQQSNSCLSVSKETLLLVMASTVDAETFDWSFDRNNHNAIAWNNNFIYINTVYSNIQIQTNYK